MAEPVKLAKLKIAGEGPDARGVRVWLEGVEITECLVSLDLRTAVNEINTVHLEVLVEHLEVEAEARAVIERLGQGEVSPVKATKAEVFASRVGEGFYQAYNEAWGGAEYVHRAMAHFGMPPLDGFYGKLDVTGETEDGGVFLIYFDDQSRVCIEIWVDPDTERARLTVGLWPRLN